MAFACAPHQQLQQQQQHAPTMLQKYKKQAKPYAATVFAGSDGGFGGRMAPPPPSWRAGDATDTPGLGFCRGAVMVVLPGAVVPDEGGDVIDDDDDISGGEIDGRAVVGPNQLELLLASALGVGRGGGGGGGAGSLLARHGFAAATVAAWCPSVPAHTSVLRVAVETAEGGDGQQEEEEEGWQAVARDVGLGRPAPEPGAVCAQVGGPGHDAGFLAPGKPWTAPPPLIFLHLL
jgi:hypothetical protein